MANHYQCGRRVKESPPPRYREKTLRGNSDGTTNQLGLTSAKESQRE